MGRIAFTKDLFLWSMSVVYLFAFSSLYVQIPGLYGDNGLLPARLVMEKEAESLEDLVKEPTLLKLMPKLGLDVQTGMDFLCLCGILLSLYCMVSHRGRDFISFTLLWMLYISLCQVGQTFLWFQWDTLLMETGFLTMLLAPFTLPFMRVRTTQPHDYVAMWLLRWLLFRLMFASGVVKLTSHCPLWWGLDAVTVHLESQCIPTPLAWYWHHFPEWFLRLSCALTYVIEIALPFLFFSPVRSLRIVAFYSQVFLQLMIILTGNYNFFNVLTIALCIPLLDDEAFFGAPRKAGGKRSMAWNLLSLLASIVVPGVVLGLGVFYTIRLFNLRLAKDYTITSKMGFTEKQFMDWLNYIMPWTIKLGAASLALELLQALSRSFTWYGGVLRKNAAAVQTLLFGAIAAAMFGISLVPLTVVHKPLQRTLDPKILALHAQSRPFHLTSSYGLFRRITGAGGRPEVVIEGSDDVDGGWKEYNFIYKPGNLSTRPPFVAPHQPRLDWQMWFAALSNYQNNPWFVTLLYRLLTAQPEVLELMGDNPFPDKPPKYVRATLYHYHYTASDPKKKGYSAVDWWTRTKQAEYVPVMSANMPALQEFLAHFRILNGPPKKPVTSQLGQGIQWMRQQVGQPEGFLFVMSTFTSGLLITCINLLLF